MRLITLFIILAAASFSDLGATEAQLIGHFGQPISHGMHSIYAQGIDIDLGVTLNFKREDWQISCDLVEGCCAKINYQKLGECTGTHCMTVLNAFSRV